MTDYREQAKADVAIVAGLHRPDVAALIEYAVAQREARLRLEEALKLALPAVECAYRDAVLTPNTPGEWWEWYEELEAVRATLNAVKEG